MQLISRHRRAGAIVGLVLALAVAAGACSKDDTTSTGTGGTTPAAPGTTAGGVTTSGAPANTIPKADVLAMQEMLDKVGCDVGPNDGIMGPETLGALLAFQKAAGITADDKYGPATKAALQQAVSSGKKDCVPPASSTTTTAKASGSTTAAPSTTASGSSAPCTSAAISAALKANGTNVVNLDGIGCANGWAYAFASVSSGPPGTVVPPGGVGVTLLLQAQGGNWVVVNRTTPCADKTVPPAIYQNACQSN
jgi:peptidoglycan hydrolase-like protein with peptidoglycan-binding domain